MTVSFIPQDRTFWKYHGSLLALLFLVQMFITFAFRKADLAFNLVSSSLWFPLFTVATLTFRYHYKTRHWHNLNMGAFIPLAVIYALASAIAVTSSMFAGTLPFFWSDYLSNENLAKMHVTRNQFLSGMFIVNAIQTQLFILIWAFIYVSVTASRTARITELNNLRLQNSLKEAQLSSLHNQLNPHFLFNTLNNIRFMIHENPDDADATITSLSSILRYSLTSTKREKVSVSEEMNIIDEYIDVVKIQLEDRLNFIVDLPENCKEYLLPPMIVQLLVENAIKHGIDNLREGGDLNLKIEEHQSSLFITVTNPIAKNLNDTKTDGTGTGLNNIHQRLKLLYGNRAEFETATESSIFTATIKLPLERQK